MVITHPKDVKAEIGIIGGSGLYDVEMFENVREIKVYTPYGQPSDNVIVGEFKGRKAVSYTHLTLPTKAKV